MTHARRTIIDPHIHLWDQRKTPRKTSPLVKLLGWHKPTLLWVARRVFPSDLIEFFGPPDHVAADYLPADYAADTASRELLGYVHVQAGWEGKGPLAPVGETRWLESLNDPRLLGIVGYADLTLGADVDSVLAAHVAASPRMRGIRFMLSHHPDKGVHSFGPAPRLALDANWRRGYAQLAKHGLSFDAWVYHHQLAELAELAAAVPEVPMTLCHAGTPVGIGGPFSQTGHSPKARLAVDQEWRDGMARLAEQPHVSVKLSGLTMPVLGFGYHQREVGLAEQVDHMAPLIDFVIDTFGVDRCFFASNFPVDKVSATYAQLYDAFEQVTASRSEEAQRALFLDNAARVYRLSP